MADARPSALELERGLRDLAGHLDYPSTPDLAAFVVARLEREAPGAAGVADAPRLAGRRGRVGVAPLGERARARLAALLPFRRAPRRAVAAALAILILAAGVAGATVLAVRGIRIVVRNEEPTPPPLPLGENLQLGDKVTLAEANDFAEFTLRVPLYLGPPDEVYLDRSVEGGHISFVWAARPGLPRSPTTRAGLLLTEFIGSIEKPLIEKDLGPGNTIDPVQVGDGQGYWISGPYHQLFLLDRDGLPISETRRLAGNTLVWQLGRLTFRLEAKVGKAEAIRIGASLR